jgi:hypothetical protein
MLHWRMPVDYTGSRTPDMCASEYPNLTKLVSGSLPAAAVSYPRQCIYCRKFMTGHPDTPDTPDKGAWVSLRCPGHHGYHLTCIQHNSSPPEFCITCKQ